jgi:hypothetical protein
MFSVRSLFRTVADESSMAESFLRRFSECCVSWLIVMTTYSSLVSLWVKLSLTSKGLYQATPCTSQNGLQTNKENSILVLKPEIEISCEFF